MTKTKIEKSDHYHEILEMIKDNKTPKFISNYLEDNYNEKISVPSIYRFKRNRYNKLVVAEADRIRKNEVVDNTDIVVNVEDDIINTVANQFNKVLELNSKALLIIDNIFNSILDKKYVDDHDLKLYRNAFKIVELSSKYSFKQYLEVNIQQNEEEGRFIELLRDPVEWEKLCMENDEYHRRYEREMNEKKRLEESKKNNDIKEADKD